MSRLDADTLNAYANEGLAALEARDGVAVRLCLAKIVGATEILLGKEMLWDRAKELYEAGKKPSLIAEMTGLEVQQIRNKAFKQQWFSLVKLNKQAMSRPKKNSKSGIIQGFIKECSRCKSKFKTQSGRSSICDCCQGLHVAIAGGFTPDD